MGKFSVALAKYEKHRIRSSKEIKPKKTVKISSGEIQGMGLISRPLEGPVPILLYILKPVQESLFTLDLETTKESIKKFQRELESLSETFGINPHGNAVVEMAIVVCKYMRVKKDSALPLSMQFLRKATRYLQLFEEKQQNDSIKRRNLLESLLLDFRTLKADVKRKNPTEAVSHNLMYEQATTKDAERAVAKSANKPLFTYMEEIRVRKEAEPALEPLSVIQTRPKVEKIVPETSEQQITKEFQRPDSSKEMLAQLKEMLRGIELIVQSVKQIMSALENNQNI